MDTENELLKAKWLLISLLAFFVSCFTCYDELRYLLRGKQASATINDVYEVRGRRGASHLKVEFTFNEEDGTSRHGADSVSLGWNPPAGGVLPVDYTPGKEGRSRIKGNIRWIPVAIFFGSIATVAVTLFKFWREANTPIARSSFRRA